MRPILDHNVVEAVIKEKRCIGESQEIMKRRRTNFNEIRFKGEVAKIYKEDINEEYEIVENKVRHCIDTDTPMKIRMDLIQD